jgi:hypothetical protein
MSAAILQGVPATTLDTDLWIDLPSRQYMKVLNLCRMLGARIVANTVVALSDDTLVNFVYQVTGLRGFTEEYQTARRMDWFGVSVRVLPLDRIHRSKKMLGRPKDLAHLPLLEQAMRLTRRRGLKA